MVEIMIRRYFITHLLVLATVVTAAAQDIRPRIAGLENNERYMSLLRDDARLQEHEDSLVTAVNRMRDAFRNGQAQGLTTDDILSLESGIFDVRNRRGRITAEISAIEQQWVLDNIATAGAGTAGEPSLHTHGHSHMAQSDKRNLIAHEAFADMLPYDDLTALREAQRSEIRAAEMADRYRALCDSMVNTAAEYAIAENEVTGIPLYEKFTATQRRAAALMRELTEEWGRIFDSKNFAYGYLLEQLDDEQLIERGERMFAERRSQAAENYGKYSSDALADFCMERAAMVEYEAAVAETLNMPAAADSLRQVLRDEAQFEFRMPRIEVQERLFLDYADIEYSSPSIYSTKNPIPEVKIYERGKIYRILLGSFWSKQAVSLFRGAAPLGWWQTGGKYLYFAGGFKSKNAADAAAAEMKKKGFKNPVVVVWREGVYRNLATDPEKNRFRLEITGVQTLSPEVKAVIAEKAPDCEVSRAGNAFVVGMFGDRSDASAAADAIRAVTDGVNINITESED